MPNWSNRYEESGNFRMFGTSPKKNTVKKNSSNINSIKSDLEKKSKKEIQDYYESIGGDEDLMNLTKDKMIRTVIKHSKNVLGLEGGKRRSKRKNKTRRS